LAHPRGYTKLVGLKGIHRLNHTASKRKNKNKWELVRENKNKLPKEEIDDGLPRNISKFHSLAEK